jgi:hypothetical protein
MNNGAAPRRNHLSECERAAAAKIGDLVQRRFGEDASSFAVMREVGQRGSHISFRIWLYACSLARGRVSTMRECVGGMPSS